LSRDPNVVISDQFWTVVESMMRFDVDSGATDSVTSSDVEKHRLAVLHGYPTPNIASQEQAHQHPAPGRLDDTKRPFVAA
jgi:hypothetical protein